MNKNLQRLFNKPMTRRQFLAHIGIGALMVLGLKGLTSNLLHYGQKTNTASKGYGSSKYGI